VAAGQFGGLMFRGPHGPLTPSCGLLAEHRDNPDDPVPVAASVDQVGIYLTSAGHHLMEGRTPPLVSVSARLGLARLNARTAYGDLPPQFRYDVRAQIAKASNLGSSIEAFAMGRALPSRPRLCRASVTSLWSC
jgi:hypothetical protein